MNPKISKKRTIIGSPTFTGSPLAYTGLPSAYLDQFEVFPCHLEPTAVVGGARKRERSDELALL